MSTINDAPTSDSRLGKFDRVMGRVMMCFFGLMQTSITASLLLYVLPRVEGPFVALVLLGVVFFGGSALMFFLYVRGAKKMPAFQKNDGSNVILRPFMANFLLVVMQTLTIMLLPAFWLGIIAAFLFVVVEMPGELLPSDLWDIGGWMDLVHLIVGLPVIFSLVLGFPFLYPKGLRALRKSWVSVTKPTGIKLDKEGFHAIGPVTGTVPWSAVTNAQAVVWNMAEMLHLIGGPELEVFQTKIDKAWPSSIRKKFTWTGPGIVLSIDYLPVDVRDLATTIRGEFLA